jgi:ATP-dependent Clp protease ATP-binding subunit ClpB
LRGIKERYELHHGIRITDDAVVSAAQLSNRYITNRFLPDKAIDLIDEAASAIKIETESKPAELDILKRRLTQLEIEETALRKEKSESAKARLESVREDTKALKEKITEFEDKWRQQKEIIEKIQEARSQIDKIKADLEIAEREVQLERAAEIKYGKLPGLEKKLAEIEGKWKEIPDEERVLREEVGETDIAKIVSRWTGIPVGKLMSTESERLLKLEDELRKRVVGQDEALRLVSNAIRRSRSGLKEESRPIGSFLFLGPTGVGKTETARALAESLFNNEDEIVRIDMSEYQESHAVARLIGAPPGYVGFEEGGQLTEAARRHPYSVVLFDEIEKAHSQVFNLFLQILDDGRLTDSKGVEVDFKNTIIIMTSNLGSNLIKEYAGKDQEKLKNQMDEVLNQTFKPEFLNRLDQIVYFNPLTRDVMVDIAKNQLENAKTLLSQQDIGLSYSEDVIKYFARKGYDPVFGARPLKRLIEQELLDEIAMRILEGKIKSGEEVEIEIENEKVILN